MMREILFKAREQAHNEMEAQKNIVEHVLRKRIFDTQKSRNELVWQRNKVTYVHIRLGFQKFSFHQVYKCVHPIVEE